MDESYYTARLVITEGCEDRLDMTITCQNAQQLLRAKDTIADQMNTYIAEFAVQSGLTGAPSNAEQNAAALQACHSGADRKGQAAGAGRTCRAGAARSCTR